MDTVYTFFRAPCTILKIYYTHTHRIEIESQYYTFVIMEKETFNFLIKNYFHFNFFFFTSQFSTYFPITKEKEKKVNPPLLSNNNK